MYLQHHGILGQKWGVRRYQNYDGTLTEAGRAKLGLTAYTKDHNKDFIIPKGTKASRFVSTYGSEFIDYDDDGNLIVDKKGLKKREDEYRKKEASLKQKYVSVDDLRKSGRDNGYEYYLSWFTHEGYDPEDTYVNFYKFKKDVKVASGERVMNEILNEIGDEAISDAVKDASKFKNRKYYLRDWQKKWALDYTDNINGIKDRVNSNLQKMGFDAIEDVNDADTDMPLIVLAANESLGKPISEYSGRSALDEYFKKYG
jgi:hypothetical protein